MADDTTTGTDQSDADDKGEDKGGQAGEDQNLDTKGEDKGDDKGNGEDKGGGDGDGGDGGDTGWRDSITDDKARKFAETFSIPADAANAAFKFRQQLSNSILKLGKKPTEDETKTFRKALGVPDTHEGYKVDIPADLPEQLQLDDAGKARLDNYLKGMHEAGATPDVVQRGVDLYYGFLAEELDAQQKGVADATTQADADLAREWGKDAKRNDEFARRAYVTFGDEATAKWLEDTIVDGVKLGDHPRMRRMYSNIGRNMGEGRLQMPVSEERGGDIQTRMDEIHSWQHGDAKEQEKYKRPAIQKELAGLYREQYGSAPIVGSEGRTL